MLQAICRSLAIFHELVFENMTLKDNHGTNFPFRKNQSLVLQNFHNVTLSSCSRAHMGQVRKSPLKKFTNADVILGFFRKFS